MGLFSRFRKKKEKPDIKPNEKPKIFLKEDDNKNIIFRKMNGSNEVNATREEAEEAVKIIKEKYANELEKPKINVMGQDIEIDILKDFNQKLDDAIIENYGTNEEIAELEIQRLKKEKIKEKTLKIDRLYDKAKRNLDFQDYTEAINVLEELINTFEIYNGTVQLAFYDLIRTYIYIKKYDKAIEVADKQIDILKGLGKDYSKVENEIKYVNELKYYRKITDLQKTAESLFYATKFDESIPYFKQAIELGSTRYQTYKCISQIYLRKKDLTSAISFLNIGITRIDSEYFLRNEHKDGLEDILENINNKIETGKFKWNCLPIDTNEVISQISDAKTILKNEDKEKGTALLEEIMSKGTFSNTVYYTLYQTYKKDNKYDDCIRVCEMAIDVLGYYDNDRFNKWTEYRIKILKLIEK